IDFANSPIYITDRLASWESEGSPRRAGVSAFGFNGTNCHVVLEEAPVSEAAPETLAWYPFVLSAKTEAALASLLSRTIRALKNGKGYGIGDVCHTLALGRDEYKHRLTIMAASMEDLLVKAEKLMDAGSLSGTVLAEERWNGTAECRICHKWAAGEKADWKE